MIYDGFDTNQEPYGNVKIIGEVWNCPTSGTSIICIGSAYITYNNTTNTSTENINNWVKIVSDPNGSIDGYMDGYGLIYNVTCH